MKKYLISTVLICITVIYILIVNNKYQQNEKVRYRENMTSLLSDIQMYRSRNNDLVASIGILTLKNNEFARLMKKDAEEIKNLKIKIKRVESYAKSVTETKIKITTVLHDTIIKHDTVKCFYWKDHWTEIKGLIKKDTISCNVESTDTIIQILHRIPKKIWFIKYGVKEVRQELVNKNPHNKIIFSQYIDLKK